MEFGTTPALLGSPDIDDSTRLEASTRLRTIAPAHTDVKPDDLSDDIIVTQHMTQPAVPNASNDTEYTPGDLSENIAAQKVQHIALIVAVSLSLVLVAFLVYVFLAIT